MSARTLAFLLLCSFTQLLMEAQPPLPKRAVQIPRDFTGQPLPAFSGGFLLAYDFERAIVWSYDRTGKTLIEVPLSLPEVKRIQIWDAAASLDGTVAVSGSATNDGGWTTVPLVFWVSPGGKVARVVRTEPFAATALAFSSDGTLWAAGRAHEIVDGIYREPPEYDVLRQYDAQGRLLRTTLPRGAFPAGVRTRATIAGAGPAASAFLMANGDRIGFYSENTNAYFELSPSGGVLGSWRVAAPPEGVDILGAALTSSGSVFLSGQRPQRPGEPTTEWKLFLYVLDKSSGALREIDFPQQGPQRATALIGSDGDDLVFYSKPPASLSWFATPTGWAPNSPVGAPRAGPVVPPRSRPGLSPR
ncbi:MAG TPA: hypothetical protein VEU27_14685 [Gemmatimonadales bacterium]|nr:hypothetical protein [Gemmatimonadales bacterium]